MELTVRIPDDLARNMSADGGDLSRRALRRLLDFGSRYELDAFLKAHAVLGSAAGMMPRVEMGAMIAFALVVFLWVVSWVCFLWPKEIPRLQPTYSARLSTCLPASKSNR